MEHQDWTKLLNMYIRLLTIIIFLSISSFCTAQSTDVVFDSLKLELERATEAAQKVALYIEIADRIRTSQSIEKMEGYLQQAAKIAAETKDKKLITNVLMERGKLFSAKGQHEEGETMFKQAFENYKAIKFERGQLTALNALGIATKRQGKYVEAVGYLEQATQLFNDSLPARTKGSVYINLGNNYFRINQFELAYEASFKALKYFEEAGYNRGVGLAYGNIGSLYKDQGNQDKALEYYQQSVNLLEKENDLKGLYNAYGNMAAVYSNKENYKTSIELHEKQLNIANQLGSIELIFANKESMASKYLSLGNIERAEALLTEIEQNTGQVSNDYLIRYYLTKAAISEEKNQLREALNFTEKAHEIGKQTGDFLSLKGILNRLHYLNDLTGNHKKAYTFLSEYQVIVDSLKSQSNIQELTTQRMQFDFDKKQETYELEKKALENQLRVQQLIRWGSLGFALLFGIIAYLIFRYYKRRNELLEKDLENKKTIEAQAKQLQVFNSQLEQKVAERTKKLEQANYELRTFNYIASHDIKEPIRNIGSYVGLIRRRLPNDLKEQFKDYFDTIKRSTNQLYTLIEDFAYYSTLSKDEVIETISVDLNLLSHNVVDNLQESIKKYQGKVVINNLPTINSSNAFLFTTLKNLVENGLKYNQSEIPTVEVSYNQTETHHEIIVSDNGIGIEPQYHEKIFEMFKRLHNRGTYEGSGIGLAIVKLVTEKLGGSVNLKSEIGKGSRFVIELPL